MRDTRKAGRTSPLAALASKKGPMRFNPTAKLNPGQVRDKRPAALDRLLAGPPAGKGDVLDQMARGKYRGPIYKGTRKQARAGAQRLLHNRFGR